MKITKEKIFKVISNIVVFLASLCTILEFIFTTSKKILSVEFEGTYSIQDESKASYIFGLLIDYLFDNWLVISILLFCIVYLIYSIIIPLYKIIRKGVKPQDTTPSYIFRGCLIVLITLLFCYHVLVDVSEAKINSITIEAEDLNEPQIKIEEPLPLTRKQIVENYIIRCNSEVIPIEELNSLPQKELYYIRNGILAFAGQQFERDYYDEFSWYDPRYSSDDVWDYITPCQRQNIDNIKIVEANRKNSE